MQFKLCSVFVTTGLIHGLKDRVVLLLNGVDCKKNMHGKRNTKGIFPSDTDVWTMEVFNYEQAILA